MPPRLVRPGPVHLSGYVAALERGWSPDNTRPEAGREQLGQIRADAADFLRWHEDPEGAGPPVTLADGSRVPRLPGLRRWIWAGADHDPAGFAGVCGLRWAHGHAPLPPHVLGHIGYAVVPWQRRRGHATRALALMLDEARSRGLPFVELTTDPDNEPSQRVIVANGGVRVERFDKGPVYGHAEGLRYRIDLAPRGAG